MGHPAPGGRLSAVVSRSQNRDLHPGDMDPSLGPPDLGTLSFGVRTHVPDLAWLRLCFPIHVVRCADDMDGAPRFCGSVRLTSQWMLMMRGSDVCGVSGLRIETSTPATWTRRLGPRTWGTQGLVLEPHPRTFAARFRSSGKIGRVGCVFRLDGASNL
jgi:hypothetical protein